MPLHSARVARNVSDALRERFGRAFRADAEDHSFANASNEPRCLILLLHKLNTLATPCRQPARAPATTTTTHALGAACPSPCGPVTPASTRVSPSRSKTGSARDRSGARSGARSCGHGAKTKSAPAASPCGAIAGWAKASDAASGAATAPGAGSSGAVTRRGASGGLVNGCGAAIRRAGAARCDHGRGCGCAHASRCACLRHRRFPSLIHPAPTAAAWWPSSTTHRRRANHHSPCARPGPSVGGRIPMCHAGSAACLYCLWTRCACASEETRQRGPRRERRRGAVSWR